MKPTTITLLFIMLIAMSANVFAQEQSTEPEFDREKLKAQKVAFITEQLDLTVDEAQQFWPVYNEFEKKRDELKQKRHTQLKRIGRRIDNLSDEECEKLADFQIQIMYDEADLYKTYSEKFRKILPARKIVLLHNVEHQFKRRIAKEIGRRMHGRQGNGNGQGQGQGSGWK